ncbi:MAG: hypothetical protein Alpg2KO_00600 [Alphaproteobacteria bacterium]
MTTTTYRTIGATVTGDDTEQTVHTVPTGYNAQIQQPKIINTSGANPTTVTISINGTDLILDQKTLSADEVWIPEYGTGGPAAKWGLQADDTLDVKSSAEDVEVQFNHYTWPNTV